MAKMAGNFDILPISKHEKIMLDDMYKTITKLELWDWLRNPNVPGKGGFASCESGEVIKISHANEYEGHSGSSFVWALRTMQNIAKYGWEWYVADIYATPTCVCQAAKGLVGWCGVAGGGVPACDH